MAGDVYRGDTPSGAIDIRPVRAKTFPDAAQSRQDGTRREPLKFEVVQKFSQILAAVERAQDGRDSKDVYGFSLKLIVLNQPQYHVRIRFEAFSGRGLYFFGWNAGAVVMDSRG